MVWVVRGDDYGDHFTESAWSSEAKAREHVEQLRASQPKRGKYAGYEFSVDVFTVDDEAGNE